MTGAADAAAARQLVLVIDDAQDIHDLVDVRLRAEDVEILHALDAASGLALARQRRPDLFLLDLDLGGQSGLDICRELMADPELASIPVIILTGTVDVATKVRAFDAGATDYVTKPFDAVELRARVRAALRTKRYLDLLATRAQLDGLTGLWNRAYFDARLGEEVAAAVRYGHPVALLMADVDHFKQVNDGCGHPFGDHVLRQVAGAVAKGLRASDVACRYGGEEIAVILRATEAEAHALAERLREAVERIPLASGGRPVHVTISVGCAATDALAAIPTPETLLAAADRGLYLAKRTGRNRVCDGSQRADEELLTTMIGQLQPTAADRLEPGSRIGPYEIVARLGGGASGVVYRAYDGRLQRDVAVKLLVGAAVHGADGWRRFAQEARALAALDHPSIVRVFDLGTAEWGAPYLVLELLEGRTVRDRLLQGPVPLAEALRLAVALAQGLAVAHAKGIIHRDLKPENLFLTRDDQLKILDFGLAKRIQTDGGASATADGMLLGTLGYLAPEQARGQPVDERTDLFALGAILFELVAGRRAFTGASVVEALDAVIGSEPPAVAPAALDAVLRRCLAKDPGERFPSARAVEAALVALQAEGAP